jgi:hypothetical protein
MRIEEVRMNESPLRRYSSLLGIAAGVIVAILVALATHWKEWSWIGGLVAGIAVATLVSRAAYGMRDARELDKAEAGPGSYASRSFIGNITNADPPKAGEPDAQDR